MKQCAQSDESRLIAAMSAQLKGLEKAFSPYRQLQGVDATPAQTIVPLNSMTVVPTGANLVFVMTWPSAPGEVYQVGMSQDAVSWTEIATPLPAAASPAVETSFTSPSYPMGARFWRVRRFPKAFEPCPA